MAIIEVKNVCYSYDGETNACDNVSFSVQQGTYTTIIGHNGSGKSTIAKCIAGLLDIKAGEIIIDGESLTKDNYQAIRHKVGIVFQNPDNQFIGSTVADDIAFGLENYCVAQEKMDDIIDRFSKRVGMEDYLHSEPLRLSGGQKQRVAIAGVLAISPLILIFDEATSMLDPLGKEEIKKVIRELHEDSSITILSITHDIEEVVYSDDVIVMNEGRVAMVGTPNDILLREKELKAMSLDIPFSLQFQKALLKAGVTIKPSIYLEEVVEQLCQFNLKK